MKFYQITICGRGILNKASSPAVAMSRAIKDLPRLYPGPKWNKMFTRPSGVRMHIVEITEEQYESGEVV